jgi:hypothetical protein
MKGERVSVGKQKVVKIRMTNDESRIKSEFRIPKVQKNYRSVLG